MTDNTQPEALRLANVCSNLTRYSMDAHLIAAELRRQHARIAEMEAQLGSSGFTAADMATAAAQGFRDGVASVAASAGSEPVLTDMVAVCREDANRYCIILRLLGMEEEGDPVAEVQRLQDLAANLQGKQHGWLYDWTHSSATGRPDESFTGFTEDENHARSGTGHRNIRAVYTSPSPPEGAGWKWVPKILSAEMVDAWASARLPGGIAQMTDDEANRAVAQANWDSMIAAAPPPPAQAADSVLEDAARYRHIRDVPHSEEVRSVLSLQQNAVMDKVIDKDRAAMAAKKGDTHE